MGAAMSAEKCDRCGMLGQDRRTLWMACFFDMSWMGIPFEAVGIHGAVTKRTGRTGIGGFAFADPGTDTHTHTFYTLRVCKGCRADWMYAIKDSWFHAEISGTCRENDDASLYGVDNELPALMAQIQSARTDLIALQQRAESIRDEIAKELRCLAAADGRP